MGGVASTVAAAAAVVVMIVVAVVSAAVVLVLAIVFVGGGRTSNCSCDWSGASDRGSSCTTRDMTSGGGSKACAGGVWVVTNGRVGNRDRAGVHERKQRGGGDGSGGDGSGGDGGGVDGGGVLTRW